MRSQRRLPLTMWPTPGIATSSNSSADSASSGNARRSSSSVRTLKAPAAATQPNITSTS